MKIKMVHLGMILLVSVLFFSNRGVAEEVKQTKAPVTIHRDEKGVWFITGNKDAPLYNIYERMGYAVAQDRLWQAELFRRTARGRLAEIFGGEQL